MDTQKSMRSESRKSRPRLVDSDSRPKRRFRSISPSRLLEANPKAAYLTPLTFSNQAGQLTGNTGVNYQQQAQLLAQLPFNPFNEPDPGRSRIDGVLDAVAQLYYRRREADSVGAGDALSNREYDTFSYPTLHLLLTPLRQPHPLDYWTPAEIVLFEAGMCSIGKDFHQLHKLIRTKTTNEIVDFYYAWKKTSHYAIWKSFERAQRKFYPTKFEQWARLDTLMDGFIGTVHRLPPTMEPTEEETNSDSNPENTKASKSESQNDESNASDSQYTESLGLGKTRRSRSSLKHQDMQSDEEDQEEEDDDVGNEEIASSADAGGSETGTLNSKQRDRRDTSDSSQDIIDGIKEVDVGAKRVKM